MSYAKKLLVRIDELGKVVTGATPPTKRTELYGDAYPFITPTDMDDRSRSVETERFISEAGRKRLSSRMLPARAVCYTCIGATIGKACMTSEPSLTNQQINSIIVDETEHDPAYVYYLLLTETERIRGMAGGAATPIINKGSFSKIEVEVHELPMQRRIAGILSGYDELIENNTRRIRLLEEMAQALYREWFVHYRFPGHEEVAMVEHDELRAVPEGWVSSTIADIALTTDYVANGSFAKLKANVTLRTEEDFALFVRTTDFNKGWSGNYRYVDESSYRFLGKSVLIGDEFIISNVGDIGTVFRPPYWLNKPMTLGSNCILVRSSNYNEWLFYFLQSDYGQYLVNGIVSGSAQRKFNKTDFRGLEITLPPDAVNARFAEFTRGIWASIDTLMGTNHNLRQTRDLLLPRLVSGALPVEAAEEELEAVA